MTDTMKHYYIQKRHIIEECDKAIQKLQAKRDEDLRTIDSLHVTVLDEMKARILTAQVSLTQTLWEIEAWETSLSTKVCCMCLLFCNFALSHLIEHSICGL